MINFTTLRKDVFRAVQPLLGSVPLIYNYQSDVLPKDNTGKTITKYATYRFVDTKEIGHHKEFPIDNNGIAKIRHLYSVTLRFQLVGNGCYDDAWNLHTKLSRPSVIQALQAIGLSLYDRQGIKDVPKFVSSAWEDRNVFDFKYYIVNDDEDNQGWIEFVEIESTYKAPDDSIVYQNTTTIDLIP